VAELTSVKTQARIAFTLQVLVLHDVLHEGSGGTQLDTFGGRFVNWRWGLCG
jgi:hypothetical protein